MDVARFKQVFDTLDEEGQKNVIAQLSDEELSAIGNFKQANPVSRVDDAILPYLMQRDVITAAKNIPSSVANVVSGLAQTISHPIDTAKLLHKGYRGAIQNVLTSGRINPYEGMEEDKRIADSIGQHYKEKFGGLENIRNTAINDPVGLMADIAGVGSLGGSVLRLAGAEKAAKVAQNISSSIDPISQSIKTTTSSIKPFYKAVVGKTSGVGPNVVEQQLRGSPEFKSAMDSMGNKVKRSVGRGGEFNSEYNIVENTQDALVNLKQIRGDAYRSKLENLTKAKEEIPIDDIKTAADGWLKRFNITETSDGLDFKFSKLRTNPQAMAEVKTIYETIVDWSTKKRLTPLQLDELKQTIDGAYSSTSQSRAMVQSLKKSVHDKVVSAVPDYAEMTKDYAKATEIIKNIERSLGAGTRSSADTTIRRLTMALREDKSLRRDLLTILDTAGKQDISASISGAISRPFVSRSLESTLSAGTLGTAAFLSSPYLAALIPLASPRIVAELNVVLGQIGRAATSPTGRNVNLGAYQAGTLNQ